MFYMYVVDGLRFHYNCIKRIEHVLSYLDYKLLSFGTVIIVKMRSNP